MLTGLLVCGAHFAAAGLIGSVWYYKQCKKSKRK